MFDTRIQINVSPVAPGVQAMLVEPESGVEVFESAVFAESALPERFREPWWVLGR